MRFLFYMASLWCLALSAFTFFLCHVDKNAARREKRRVPEKRFFLLALCGGVFGLAAGMLCFRHKTRHIRFVLIVCVFLPIWTAALFLLAVNAFL